MRTFSEPLVAKILEVQGREASAHRRRLAAEKQLVVLRMGKAAHNQDDHILKPKLVKPQFWCCDFERIMDVLVGCSPMVNAELRQARGSLGSEAEGFQQLAVKKILHLQLFHFQT